jgi:thioredoxin 1
VSETPRRAGADPWKDELGFIPHLPGAPEAINADSFDEDVLDAPVPVLVEFWAARCGPCRRLAPEMAAVAATTGDRARVFTLNVDEELEAAERFGVRAIPATLLFVGGEERARHVGVIDRRALMDLLRPFINHEE